MKKFYALILIGCIILSLAGCKTDAPDGESFYSYFEYVEDSSDTTESEEYTSSSNDTQSSSSKTESKNDTPSQNSSVTAPQTPPKAPEKPTAENNSPTVENVTVNKEEIKEPETEKLEEEVKIETHHIPLAASKYYQFSTLTGKEKEIYGVISNCASKALNIADISRLKVKYETAYTVLQKFIADNPQYFYISRSFIITSNADTGDILAIIISYTDGTVTDTFDDSLNLIKSADRKIISEKIEKFNKKIEGILSNIPSNFTELEKEKLIHDYIQKTVTYDYNAATTLYPSSSTLPHAYDIYGAAVNGKAVCEGYSKLFQYLCYCTGINSTQVTGIADGGAHMWNAVNIDGKWYQIDVTWDDGSDYLSYSYFNLTTSKIGADHQADTTYTSVPDCTATENSAINTFVIYVSNMSNQPDNYKSAIDMAVKLKDKRIYVYFDNPQTNNGIIDLNYYMAYIQRYFFNNSTGVGIYVQQKGLNIASTVNGIGDMLYLTVK